MESDRYEIVYNAPNWSRIDRKWQDNIRLKIERHFALDPLPHAKKMIVPKLSALGKYRWRIGKYRIFFNIDHERKQIFITEIKTRKEAYQ